MWGSRKKGKNAFPTCDVKLPSRWLTIWILRSQSGLLWLYVLGGHCLYIMEPQGMTIINKEGKGSKRARKGQRKRKGKKFRRRKCSVRINTQKGPIHED